MSDGTLSFAQGLSRGMNIVIDLALGEQMASRLPADKFEELRYKGEKLPGDLRRWLEGARERAAEVTNRLEPDLPPSRPQFSTGPMRPVGKEHRGGW